MGNMYLSVIIPSYNEKENLQRGVLGEVRDYLKKQGFTWEVIVIDDGTPDLEARELAKSFCEQNKGFRFIQADHGGKAKTVFEGVKAAAGEIILFTDMDQSTPISELAKVLPKFREGYDIVIGSRGLERKNFSVFRQMASSIFRNLRLVVLSSRIVDTQAGFKAFKSSVAKELFPLLTVIKNAGVVNGWTVSAFDVELLTAAEVRGYRIAEVPIEWADRDESVAKATERKQGRYLKESLDMAKEVFMVKYYQLRGAYNRK